MKVIFLDIDGVLCHENSKVLDPVAIDNLDFLLTCHSDLKIVISSARRMDMTVDELKIEFSSYDFHEHIIDRTLDRDSDEWYCKSLNSRGAEISHWLGENIHVKNYVIFDDYDDLIEGNHGNSFVQVNPRMLLTKKDILLASELLK